MYCIYFVIPKQFYNIFAMYKEIIRLVATFENASALSFNSSFAISTLKQRVFHIVFNRRRGHLFLYINIPPTATSQSQTTPYMSSDAIIKPHN